MRRSRWATGVGAGLLATLAVPAAALADGRTLTNLTDVKQGATDQVLAIGINSVWVLVAGILVMFMQAGFAFLEIGFSRGKNAGTVIAKILVNFSIAAICFYAVGFAFAFGSGNEIIGTSGFFLAGADAAANFPLAYSGPESTGHVTVETLWFFQFVFCAVSLAIVWGTTLERVKFGVYVDLRDRLLGAHLPDRRPLDLRRRLARHAVRHAGLRRFDGRPPDRVRPARSRCCCCSARVVASTALTASRGRSRATTCRCSASAS